MLLGRKATQLGQHGAAEHDRDRRAHDVLAEQQVVPGGAFDDQRQAGDRIAAHVDAPPASQTNPHSGRSAKADSGREGVGQQAIIRVEAHHIGSGALGQAPVARLAQAPVFLGYEPDHGKPFDDRPHTLSGDPSSITMIS